MTALEMLHAAARKEEENIHDMLHTLDVIFTLELNGIITRGCDKLCNSDYACCVRHVTYIMSVRRRAAIKICFILNRAEFTWNQSAALSLSNTSTRASCPLQNVCILTMIYG
ncbi:hypothetical protein JOB18_025603 [Solea senegalensis]|uniref:Uncharacterized protein n=1 Tax=Solea senegalensis TaxID=28829 RepID=A0AAV6QCV5_SOLSE|nr:hypothetical protein JOB18_025603 [Solea senegalensis]